MKQIEPEPSISWRARGRLVLYGALFALAGAYRIKEGEGWGYNSRGQPVHPSGMVAMGVVLFILAAIPSSWINYAAKIRKRKKF